MESSQLSRRLHALLFLVGTIPLYPAVAYAKEAPTHRIAIPAGELEQSLEELSRQLGIQILFDADRVKGLKSPAVSGVLSTEAAIDLMLVGTSLTAQAGTGDSFLIAFPSVQAISPSAVNSQRANAGADLPLEEVTVTGTHIRGEVPVGTSVTSYEREDFDTLGASTVDTLARSLLENFSGADSFATLNTNGNVGSFQQGAATNMFAGAGFDLLGLGPRATLTLMDGHRVAPGGLDGSIVDVSLLPLSAVDHVEVLVDGASAIYGSDAVAGVVNIVTRRALEGTETSLRYGQSTERGAGEFTGSQLLGHGWSTGNLLFDYEFDDERGLDASQRDWLGPEGGPYSLIPDNHRHSFFLTGSQEFQGTAVSFNSLYSTRDFRVEGLQLNTAGFVPNSDIAGGHANLTSTAVTVDRDLPAAWQVTGTATYSRMNQWISGEEFPDGLTGEHFDNALLADSTLSGVEVSGSGGVLDVPAGSLRLALGGGFRSESFVDSIPSIEPLPTMADSRTDLSAYGEATVPVFGDNLSFPGLQRLSLSTAYRLDSYSHFGADTDPKLGWTWEPLAGLTLRGTRGTSFRVPLIAQLYTPTTSYTTLLPADTPGGKPTDALVINGGSPYLQPEKSKFLTAGMDWAPLHWPGIRGSLSYINITYDDRIQSQNIEASPLDTQAQLASLTLLNPTLAEVLPFFQGPTFQQDGAGLGPAGVTAIIDNQFADAYTTVEQSILFNGQYTVEGGKLGKWKFSIAGNYVLVDRTSLESGFPQASNVTNTIAEPPKFRTRGMVAWQYDVWTADLMLNHSSAYQNTLFTPAQGIGSWTTVDLTVKFNLPYAAGALADDLGIVVNMQNLADRRPPLVAIPPGDVAIGRSAVPFDGTNASAVGRYLSVEFRKGWR